MSVKHTTDFAPLLDAVASLRLERIAQETTYLLKRQVSPFLLIGHAGIPAAWGDTEGHPLCGLAAGGRIADWMRSIPANPESESAEQRLLAPALPVAQALVLAAPAVQVGQKAQPALPEPLFPANITHQGGMGGALREAVCAGQVARATQLLLGYYATGTDYRAYLSNVYRAISEHYSDDGHILIFTHRSSQVLDIAGWADKLPPFIHWLTPHLATTQPDAPFLADVHAFLSEPAHDLMPLRTRLTPANNAAAGVELRQAILQGSLGETCEAVFAALMNGARASAVGSVVVLAAARRLLNTPADNFSARQRAAHGFLLASAARTAVTELQEIEVLPILFLAAAAINARRDVEPGELAKAPAGALRAGSGVPGGGLLAPVLLRSLERQLEEGDAPGAEISARRYLQLGHPARGLVAMLAAVACQGDATSDQGHTLLLAQAAGEEYLALPLHLQNSDGDTLLEVAIRAATARPKDRTVFDALRQASA